MQGRRGELATSVEGGIMGKDDDNSVYDKVIREICGLDWISLTKDGLINVAWAYYYFSVQFCENVGLARILYPNDERLKELDSGERDTDNLSPWPRVAEIGERIDHCEFMRRTLELSPIDEARRLRLESIGNAFLIFTRSIDPETRALSLPSYEDGGLERVFRAILQAPTWDDPLLHAFRHFLEKHITLDSDPDHGHGSLCRFLQPNAKVLGLWTSFKQILIESAPELLGSGPIKKVERSR